MADFGQDADLGTDIYVMVHTNPQSRLGPTARLFQAMAWGGLATAAISMTSLVLFSIYHLLSGVVSGAGTELTSKVWLIGVVVLAVAAASSIIGFTLGVDVESRASASESQHRPTIAA